SRDNTFRQAVRPFWRISTSHLLGVRQAIRLSCGVLKQVRHDVFYLFFIFHSAIGIPTSAFKKITFPSVSPHKPHPVSLDGYSGWIAYCPGWDIHGWIGKYKPGYISD